MSPDFSSYDYVAIAIPGAALLLGAILMFPQYWSSLDKHFVNLGGFGLLIVVAFVAGQVVHEAGGWTTEHIRRQLFGELPSQRVLDDSQTLITEEQRQRLATAVKKRFKFDLNENAPSRGRATRSSKEKAHIVSKKKDAKDRDKERKDEWYLIGREIYVLARNANRTERIDTFLINYGLCRGLAFVSFLLAMLAFVRAKFVSDKFENSALIVTGIVLLCSAVLLYQRMIDSGISYARELFLVYLTLSPA